MCLSICLSVCRSISTVLNLLLQVVLLSALVVAALARPEGPVSYHAPAPDVSSLSCLLKENVSVRLSEVVPRVQGDALPTLSVMPRLGHVCFNLLFPSDAGQVRLQLRRGGRPFRQQLQCTGNP